MPSTLFYWFTHSAKLSDLQTGLNLAKQHPIKSLLLLAASENDIDLIACNNILINIDIPLFGGIYPMLINQNEILKTGYILVGFADEFKVHNIDNVSQIMAANDDAIEHFIDVEFKAHNSQYLLFHDALSPSSERFIDAFFYSLGNVKIIGGGAGSLDFVQQPCVFTNQGVKQDIMQLVCLPYHLALGMAHGWQILDGPYLVTDANDHIVHTLNYRPAFEIYKNSIEKLSGYRFDRSDFFDIAKKYPLGIQGSDGEILVRDPIQETDNGLNCVGNVPTNAMVYILKGHNKALIASTGQAVEAIQQQRSGKSQNLFVVDCISRILYLDDDFSQEVDLLATAQKEGDYMYGVLSLGEVTNINTGAIKLLNKSTVLGCF